MNTAICLALDVLFATGFHGGLLAPTLPSETQQVEPVTIMLRQLDETRRVTLIETDEMGFQFDEPGLVLTYDLEVADGLTVHAIEQPSSVVATDSTGTDLSLIKEGFRGAREYVELAQSWGDPPSGFTFRLLPTARGATTFNLKSSLNVIVFGELEELTIQPSDQWQEVDPTHFAGDKVEAKLSGDGFGGDGAQLSLRPGSAREAIHEVFLIDGENEVQSTSVMWSGASAHYGFDHPYREGQRVRIVIRTNLQSLPVTLDLREQPLP